jgi:hypothetical protein
MIKWINGHETMLLWMTGISVITFIGSLIAVPWLVVRIPSDYFSGSRRHRRLWVDHHPVVRFVLHTVKNFLGYALILSGLVMLVLPGQGMLTILIGIIFIDIPGKYRFERWVVSRPAVYRAINWLRRRAGHENLEL